MKKIALVGEWYSNNLGDGLLCQVVEKILSVNYEIIRMDLSLKSNYETLKKENFNFNVHTIKKNQIKAKLIYLGSYLGINYEKIKYRNYYRSYKKKIISFFYKNRIDGVVFAGGQIFSDSFIQRIKIILDVASKNDIPIFFNACGYSKKMTKQNRKALVELINNKNVRYISVRDGSAFLSRYSKKAIYSTFDTALCCSKLLKKSKNTKFDLGLGIMYSPYQSLSRQVKFWNNLISNLRIQKINWKIFVNGSSEDYQFATYILKNLQLNVKDYLLERPSTPDELVDTILKFDKIITMRLHSVIVSYSYKIPVEAIIWHSKVCEFFKKINAINMLSEYETPADQIIQKVQKVNKENEFKEFERVELNIQSNIERLKNNIDIECE